MKFCKNLKFAEKCEKFDGHLPKYWGLSGAKACKSCRSRQELSNDHLLAKFGFDRTDNEPDKTPPRDLIVTYIPRPESWASLWCCTLCGYRIENWFCSVCAARCALCLGAGCGAGVNHLRKKQSFHDARCIFLLTSDAAVQPVFGFLIDCRQQV